MQYYDDSMVSSLSSGLPVIIATNKTEGITVIARHYYFIRYVKALLGAPLVPHNARPTPSPVPGPEVSEIALPIPCLRSSEFERWLGREADLAVVRNFKSWYRVDTT